MNKKRLAILITHPIQYYSPVFRLLAGGNHIAIKVFYSWGAESIKKYDPGFSRVIEWDIPLLEGYEYEFLENNSGIAGSHHFWGITNPRLVERVNAWKPDGILVFGWNYYSHLKALQYYHGRIPVWFRGDSTLIDDRPFWKKTARRLVLTWVYHHIDKALYVGSNNKQYYLEYGLREKQLVFAPHAVDNEWFADNESRRYQERADTWRQEIGLSDEDIVVLFAGKLERKKGVDLLLNTFTAMHYNNLKLMIVGNGVEESTLKSMAYEDGRVHFLPFQNQSQMPVVYRLGDIFCLPSRGPEETWGLAVNEAMACGRAILVSDRCGCAIDLVKNGENGLIFQSGNIDDLRQKLKLLFASGHQGLERSGLKSKALISDWSIEHLAKAISGTVKSN